ncbi:toxin CptA [Allochromatium warmingii]|uniref:Toxin CptA n=1 Tax=Allochromatium warmingii TaxID=61595 RepID=A0A1H3AN18_ALLWA|nr:protein YgfX [Allochromatium warmingii]SDX30995.1 toxin CptA [Allochromatium warmingii]
MSTPRTYPPLVLEPRVSRWLLGVALIIALLALAVTAVLPLGWLRLPLTGIVFISAWWTLWCDVLGRAPVSIQSATWESTGYWVLQHVSGYTCTARLATTTFFSPVGVALVFIIEESWWRRRTLALAPDSLDANTLRRLRQRLRLAGARIERDA